MQVNCIILWKTKRIEFARKEVDGNRIKVSDTWKPEFEPSNFIPQTIHKRWFEFWKKERQAQYLILVEDYEKAIVPGSGKFDDYWTKKEAMKHVAKQVSQSRDQQKPFTNWQIVFLIIMIMASTFLTAFLTKIMIVGFQG